MSEIIKHQNKIENQFDLLSSRKIFTFGIFCAERQWLVYKKATNNKPNNNQQLFRRMLDEVWDWLMEKHSQINISVSECEQAIINKVEDDNDTFASDITVSFYNLINSIENDQPADVLQTIEHSLNAIDFLLQDFVLKLPVLAENNLLINSHELIKNEINEQNYCLGELLNSNFSVQMIELLRKRATGKSIFGKYWFE